MTPAPSLFESALTERFSAAGRAASALVAAVLARLFRRAATAGPDGPLLAQNGRGDGPPDLDELWRDFNRKLSGLFGRGGGPRGNGGGDPNGGPSFQPNLKSAGVGAALIAGVKIGRAHV